ncbi:MAG: glycosyltransferase family 39 protein [Acidobacteria bacterium]|nr:glycosyltransferase family 39 protein [Acidobacteriota bacterium]
MDDVDAVQAQIARNMLDSGDWVTARLNGVAYLEKSPLVYWLMAVSFKVFGASDWAARLPLALATVALCWITARFGAWAFGPAAGLWAGVVLSTSIGLWLFTRILIPDALLTLAITLAMWGFLRALDPDEPHPRLWAAVMAACIGAGLLLKGLIAAVFPLAAALLYLAVTRQFSAWRKLHPFSGLLIALTIAAPWHVLAVLRNPPHFDFTPRSVPGEYHGFFWFYFLNEHVFRFLNMRHPRDYNTVPRLAFWLFHLLWLFPWSAWLPAAFRKQPEGRAARARLLAICWTGFILVFFTFSTTQEYYSLPCYPALAMLLGAAIASPPPWVRAGPRVAAGICAVCALAAAVLSAAVWNTPAPGDIAQALTHHPEAYTLSLGHMGDLTLQSLAYLKLPLAVAAVAFACGSLASKRTWLFAVMLALFFHAARLALVSFDPYLGSRDLARAVDAAPPGTVILDNQYYTFSSVVFYTNRRVLLLNGRVNNLEYGSHAPGAPNVFLTDADLPRVWRGAGRHYLLVEGPSLPRIEKVLGRDSIRVRHASGGKFLLEQAGR